jgi:hypothetical protein
VRTLSALLPLLVPLLGVVDCGPVTVVVSGTPVNDCSSACAAYCPKGATAACSSRCSATLSGEACLSKEPLPSVIVVVDVPEGSMFAYGQGLTYALETSDITSSPCMKPLMTGGTCFKLPDVARTSGAYVAPSGQFAGVDFLAPTTIPVQTTFVPQWLGVLATNLGLPLPNTIATTATNNPALNLPAGVVGPEGGQPITWTALYPANQTSFADVQVLPPYDEFIPPLIDGLVSQIESGTFAPSSSVFTTDLVDLKVPGSPAGWSVVLREKAAPQRIVTSRGSVVNQAARLYSLVDVMTGDYEVVITPPPGRVMPQVVEGYIPTLGIPYPPLPPPVKVSGTLVSPGGTAVSGTVHFVASGLYEYPGSSCMPSMPGLLVYDAFVYTDPTSPGAFSVTLPQGAYDVTIDPESSSGLAKTTLTNVGLPAVAKCPVGDGIEGLHLTAPNPQIVTGTVQIANGEPLANANVVFAPAATLLGHTTPPSDWPRQASVTTRLDGTFTAEVDPNATYDITVRPVDGTRLPWVVSSAFPVFDSKPLKLFVPAPVGLPLTIHDPNEFPVTQAVVRAYALTGCASSGPSCTPTPAIQIGEALTDSSGSFELFLTPVPFRATSP